MSINMNILYALEGIRTPFLNYLALGISYLGSEAVSVIVLFILYWCISKKDGLFLLTNVLLATGTNQIVKLFTHVPRPFAAHKDFSVVKEALPTTGGFSFPSGHTQNSTSLFGSLAVMYKKRIVRILCAVMIILVGFSRLYLGAHYPTDILGGFLIGLAILILVSFVFRRFEDRPNLVIVLFAIGTVAMIVTLLLYEYGPLRGTVEGLEEPERIADMVKNLGICAGCSLAVTICIPIERKYVRFETDAVWWAQILKVAIGLGIVFALAKLMKYPVSAIFGENSLGHVLRYFVPAVFAFCIWPMAFRWFPKRKKPAVTASA